MSNAAKRSQGWTDQMMAINAPTVVTPPNQRGMKRERVGRKERQKVDTNLLRSLAVKGEERAVRDWVKDRCLAARLQRVCPHSSRPFHISGTHSTSSKDLALSTPSHKPSKSVPQFRKVRRHLLKATLDSITLSDDTSFLSNSLTGSPNK